MQAYLFIKFLQDNNLKPSDFSKLTKISENQIESWQEQDSPHWMDELIKSEVLKKKIEEFHKKFAKEHAARIYIGNNWKMIPAYEKSIACLHPELSSEWDNEKNGVLKPEHFTEGSHDHVWWLCSKNGHSFQKAIRERIQKGRALCPMCGHSNVAIPNNITITHPTLMEEWNYEKNIQFSPNQISAKSTKLVGWICKYCKKEWESRVSNRTSTVNSLGGCSHCSALRRSAFSGNTLAKVYPHIASEWHPTLNEELHITPEEISPFSNLKVWWKCKEQGHEWQATVQSRNNSGTQAGRTGRCPHCVKIKYTYNLNILPGDIISFLMINNLSKAKLSKYLGIGPNTLTSYIEDVKPIPDQIKNKLDDLQQTLNKEK